jgi:hypothetical protein
MTTEQERMRTELPLFLGISIEVGCDVKNDAMGKYLGASVIAACVALAGSASAAPAVEEAPTAAATVAVQQARAQATGLRDEAAMVLVGTALIGLAAAVRRAAA